MIKFKQLRDAVIEYETDFINSTNHENPAEVVENMVTELSDTADIDDIIAYYCNSGFQLEEAYENILKVLMAKSTIISSLNKR